MCTTEGSKYVYEKRCLSGNDWTIQFSQLSLTICESIDHASKLRNIEIRFSLDEDETTPFLFPSNSQSEEKRDHSRFSPRVSCQDNRIPRVTTRPNRTPFRSLPFPRSVAWNRGDAKKEFPFKTIPRVSRAVHSRQIFTDFLHFHLIPPRWSRRNNGRPNYFFSLSAYCGGSDFWKTILPFITRIFY